MSYRGRSRSYRRRRSEGYKGKGAPVLKRGDWFCPECDDHQFARNVQCRRCGAARPTEDAVEHVDADAADGQGEIASKPDETVPIIENEEFLNLREEYLACLEHGRTREDCDALHEMLMDIRFGPKVQPSTTEFSLDDLENTVQTTIEDTLAETVVDTEMGNDIAVDTEVSSAPDPSQALGEDSRPNTLEENFSRAPTSGNENGSSSSAEGRVFIGGLPKECSDDELHELVSQVLPGQELLECNIREGMCCGYIRFASKAVAEEAINELHGREVKGWDKALRARWATPKVSDQSPGIDVKMSSVPWRTSREGGASAAKTVLTDADNTAAAEGRRLFVGQVQNMPVKDVEDKLWRLFKPYGDIVDLRYLTAKSVAYVTYKREQDARWAQRDTNDKHVPGLSRRDGMNVQIARPKDKDKW